MIFMSDIWRLFSLLSILLVNFNIWISHSSMKRERKAQLLLSLLRILGNLSPSSLDNLLIVVDHYPFLMDCYWGIWMKLGFLTARAQRWVYEVVPMPQVLGEDLALGQSLMFHFGLCGLFTPYPTFFLWSSQSNYSFISTIFATYGLVFLWES